GESRPSAARLDRGCTAAALAASWSMERPRAIAGPRLCAAVQLPTPDRVVTAEAAEGAITIPHIATRPAMADTRLGDRRRSPGAGAADNGVPIMGDSLLELVRPLSKRCGPSETQALCAAGCLGTAPFGRLSGGIASHPLPRA